MSRAVTLQQTCILAALERLPAKARAQLGWDIDLTPAGWRVVLVWQVPPRVGSCCVFGRAAGEGLSLEAAEQSLLAQIQSLPLQAELS